MRSFVSDLRHAVRALIKVPGFTVVATLILALGIGLNTAIFSLIDQLLLRPLPGDREPGQLVGLYSHDTTRPDAYRDVSYPNYLDIRNRNNAFTSLAAYTVTLVGIREGELTRPHMAFVVTSNFFETFGVRPILGRGFLPEEEVPGTAPVVILSEEYWRKLGRDLGIVGKTLEINARLFTVAGVMPRGFGGPSTLISPAVWLPTGVYDILVNQEAAGSHTRLGDRENHALLVAGRLKPGLTAESADPMLKAIAAQMREEFPGAFRDQSLEARPLSRMSIGTAPQDDSEAILPSALLQAMAATVLLIACMNLANMMLARGSARRREVAIRLSLGAGRARIVRQVLTEGFVLSLAGGAAGLVLTYWALRFFQASLDPMLPLLLTVNPSPDARLLAVTFGFSVVATLAFGLGPALRLSRINVVAQVKEGDTAAPEGGVAGFHLRHALVVGQIALSLAMLTAAGLFTRYAFQVSKADPGFSLDRGLLVSLDPGLAAIGEPHGREFYRRLIERVRGTPGVEAASLASLVPFGNFTEGRRIRRVGEESGGAAPRDDVGGVSSSYGAGNSAPRDNEQGIGAIFTVVGRDYFEAIGLPVLRGRGFSDLEEQAADGPHVVVINETLARRLFGDADPLGQYIYFPDPDRDERQPREVVGVVAESRHSLFDRAATPHVYVPFGQHYRSSMHLHIRPHGSGSDTAALLQLVRREVRAIDERVPIVAEMTLREHRDSSMSAWLVRTGADAFALFGAAAVLLALVGVYGVRAYLVSRRTREIGIRMALGATVRDVVWLVLREGMLLVAIGLAIGLGLAVIGLVVARLRYDVSVFDPLVFSLAPLLLALSALVACLVPAWRAARIAPGTALRAE